MSNKRWQLTSSKPVFTTPYISINDNNYLLPNGKKAEHFYQLVRKNYILVLVFNDKNEILVEKQYRWGVDDFVYELPVGLIDKSESPEVAATREVQEETGYVLKDVSILGEIYVQPGFCTMKAYVIKGQISSKTSTNPEFDEEDTELEFMDLDTIKKLVKDGTIKDMGFISALSFI